MKLKKLEEALLNEEDKYKLDLDTNKKLALEIKCTKKLV